LLHGAGRGGGHGLRDGRGQDADRDLLS
jgi:hypothetical protein